MRGIIGEGLTPAIATEYGSAFGTFLKSRCAGKKMRPSVCIGRDSRPSGPILQEAIKKGLCAVGVDVVELGIVTTPSVGVMLRHLQSSGGVVVTASHNPIEYNGIKLLLDNGIAPPPQDAAIIKQHFLSKDSASVSSLDCGQAAKNDETDAVHISKVLAIADKQKIAANRFKVVLDSVNGAGGGIVKKLLSSFGCEVCAINDEPTGMFAHTPEPIAKNLTGLCEIVKREKAHAGFALDPDADRLAIVDEKGTYIGEEYTLALAAEYIFSKRPERSQPKAATNLSTSRMIDDIAEKYRGEVIRTPVGEANVAAAMIRHNCVIGGEGNGGVIDLRVGPVRDSLVGITLVLQMMAETGKTISGLAGTIPRYYMFKDKFTADKQQAEDIFDEAKKCFASARLDTSDGCRFDFDDGWLHLRISNTEPVMRLIVEAKNEQAAQKYVNTVLKMR